MTSRPRVWAQLTLGGLLVAVLGSGGSGSADRLALAQSPPSAKQVVDGLSPAQRVGQLFLVPIEGEAVAEGSAAARLVRQRFVGGVILDPARGNFVNRPDAPAQVARLANALQSEAEAAEGPFLPLFIALDGRQGGLETIPLRGGMTPLPSAMALGATWQPEDAAKVGEVLGRELAAVGVNLLIGPSLDVSAVPRPGSTGDLGAQVFGGSPYWTGLLGGGLIGGLHRGAGRRLAVAAASFPGVGAADRGPAEEGAVVDGSLAALLDVDLVPFLMVTDLQAKADSVVDALVSSHVRYRGIQPQPDAPLSLDSGGLPYLWAQVPTLSAWRGAGGVVVSASLGSPSVRRYLDRNLASFNVRQVVGKALLAGNDLLTLTEFGPPGDPSGDPEATLANIEAGIDWLTQAYGEDENLRRAVNEAAERVVGLKLRLYGSAFGGGQAKLDAVQVDAEAAPTVAGLGMDTTVGVARRAITQLLPDSDAGEPRQNSLVPRPGDQLLFVIDTRESPPCEGCAAAGALDPEAFVARVRQAYGHQGSGLALLAKDEDAQAITFTELKAWLQFAGVVSGKDTLTMAGALPAARRRVVDRLLRQADWLVFAMLDLRPAEAPASDALKLFLRSQSLRLLGGDRRLVAIAFDAPYYLDTTEMSRLSAFYAAYAQGEPFVDAAVRALFGDLTPEGASPVSVPGVTYDLAARLEPAANQSIALEVVGLDPSRGSLPPNRAFTVRTGVIRDANGHPVPDGTPVRFRRYYRADDVFLADVPATTAAGIASAQLRGERSGELEISILQADTLIGQPLTVAIGSPGFSLPGNLTSGTDLPGLVVPQVPIDWGVFLLSLSLMLLAGVVVYGVDGSVGRSPTRLIRLVLLSLAWGLTGYLLVAAGGLRLGELPGGAHLWPEDWSPAYQAPLLSFSFALLPVVPTMLRAIRS